MDFVDWCTKVLSVFDEEYARDINSLYTGVHLNVVVKKLFNTDIYESHQPAQDAVLSAIRSLEHQELIFEKNIGYEVKREAGLFLEEPTSTWEGICSQQLKPDEARLLRILAHLSEVVESDYADVRYVSIGDITAEFQSGDRARVEMLYKLLEDQLGYVQVYPALNTANSSYRITYAGLVWVTRQGLTRESKRIDELVREWETTSVDFKRELALDTADQKAEFVKDMLGLVNTQASGRRLFIIGFEPKTHEYYGPPNPKLKQDQMEQILARCTTPVVDIRYEVISYRSGLVGQVEAIRDPKKLPYSVAINEGSKGKGGKRSIEVGQIFVRHGSQTEEPTPKELEALVEEGKRARGEEI